MLLLGFILVTIRNILGVHFGDIFILEAGSRTLGFVLGDNLGIYLGDTLGAYWRLNIWVSLWGLFWLTIWVRIWVTLWAHSDDLIFGYHFGCCDLGAVLGTNYFWLSLWWRIIAFWVAIWLHLFHFGEHFGDVFGDINLHQRLGWTQNASKSPKLHVHFGDFLPFWGRFVCSDGLLLFLI